MRIYARLTNIIRKNIIKNVAFSLSRYHYMPNQTTQNILQTILKTIYAINAHLGHKLVFITFFFFVTHHNFIMMMIATTRRRWWCDFPQLPPLMYYYCIKTRAPITRQFFSDFFSSCTIFFFTLSNILMMNIVHVYSCQHQEYLRRNTINAIVTLLKKNNFLRPVKLSKWCIFFALYF